MDGLNGLKTKLFLLLLLTITATTCGCASVVSRRAALCKNAIPAHQLPREFAVPARDQTIPIDFSLLRQPIPAEHRIGAGDVLGVYVESVLAEDGKLPAVYFPPQERMTIVESPSVGHPLKVQSDGTLSLPYLPPFAVQGLTLAQAAEQIRQAYLSESILTPNQDQVTISLLKRRSVKVYVIREDTSPGGLEGVNLINSKAQVLSRRGSAKLLELPVYENNVLRVLTETGGLPGTDAYNAVWVIRSDHLDENTRQEVMETIESGDTPEHVLRRTPSSSFTKIPLRICPGQPLPFSPQDAILHDGDIVFIEERDEFFITGGLISGGKFPLPRDRDVDILEALAIANANVNGPAGNATATLFRSGPGNIIPPTCVYVIRRLDNGEQIKIFVDIKAAMNDPNERINLKSGDLVLLKYRAWELIANIAMNYVNVGYAIPNR